MCVASVAVSLPVLVSPPPETVAVLITLALMLIGTFTVRGMAGELAPGGRTTLRVQVRVASVQAQPVPLMAVGTRVFGTLGSVSTTVTVPTVGPCPEFLTVMV